MNLHVALARSIELTDDPRAFAGKLLAEQRQVIETLRETLDSDSAYVLGFDCEEWETEANELFELWQQMFERFRG